ncbi:MAG: hypothetical protein KDI44_02625 [Thiothrix sp.]|nr:hypothetical protein [Thiothrix sp.]HPQ94190.1 hypothetical protein [Thiolinea sp.]
MKEFSMTLTANALSATGSKLRLVHPASAFTPGKGCEAPPYQLPDPAGGYVTLVEYGEPVCEEGCGPAKKQCNSCGCGGRKCGNPRCSDPKCDPGPEMSGTLRRYEVIQYDGYDTDGMTLLLKQRAVEGLVDQEWPAGTLVLQSGAAPYISMLEKMGCLLAVKKAKDCIAVKEGEWVADPDCKCWRQAKRDMVIAHVDGALDFPKPADPENEMWSRCYTMKNLLNSALRTPPSLFAGSTASGWDNAIRMAPGTPAIPKDAAARVYSGGGDYIESDGGNGWVVPYDGVYAIDMEFGMEDSEDGIQPDQDSTYQYTLFDQNGLVVNRVEIDTTDMFEHNATGGGGSAGKRVNKDIVRILKAGDVLTRNIIVSAGGGGHTLSSAFCRIIYMGEGDSKLL